MRLIYLLLTAFALSCSDEPRTMKTSIREKSAKQSVEEEAKLEPPIKPEQSSSETSPSMSDDVSSDVKPGPTPIENMPSLKPEAKLDPETLGFPVVFHLGGSSRWQNELSLRAVIAETHRILQQAKIEIQPSYTNDMNPTAFLDVYYVPEVPNEPGINGISYENAALEVYVIDNVGLGKVDDLRPTEVAAPRFFKAASDKIPVSVDEAEQARTTAHEICHQLGLPHRQDSTNLLASGTTGWTLNAAEIATVRNRAVTKFAAKFPNP